MLSREFFQRDPVSCARALIGSELVWENCRGKIVETEAYYEQGDEACHTFLRPASRKFIAERLPGTAYVYLNYGMHWLLNVLIKSPTANGFVLIRALQPMAGLAEMEERRRTVLPRNLCSGPGKLTMACGIGGERHGFDLCTDETRCLVARTGKVTIVADARVGISRATDKPWRFLLKDSLFVSVPPGKALKIPLAASRAAIAAAVPPEASGQKKTGTDFLAKTGPG